MRRQRYLWLACALGLVFPELAPAQSAPTQMPRIGLLAWSDCDEPLFLRGLEELGYRPGETVTIECRNANRSYDGLGLAAAELAGLGVDVIVSMSQPAGMAAHDATHTIPIVSIVSGDPVAVGLAKSLAQPGGNFTGLSYYANELTAKRLDLLKEAMPELATVDVLANPAVSYLPFEEDAKQDLTRVDLERAITAHERAEKTRVGTLIGISEDGVFGSSREDGARISPTPSRSR